MQANLTDYINCFSAFYSGYNATNDENSISKAINCYKNTIEFIDSLSEHIPLFPELQTIQTTLREINNLFADLLLVKTNGLIRLDEKSEVNIAYVKRKTEMRGTYILARKVIEDRDKIDNFLQSIDVFIHAVNDYKNNVRRTRLAEDFKLDSMDGRLAINKINGKFIQTGNFGSMKVGYFQVHQNNQSAMPSLTNGTLPKAPNNLDEIPELVSIDNTCSKLKEFMEKTRFSEHAFGIDNDSNLGNRARIGRN